MPKTLQQKQRVAEKLGLEVEDLCTKCEADEEYDFGLCITCAEEAIDDEE